MGTSGNRPGNKVFSISTTIRNPKRNTEFLNAFRLFSGKALDDNNMNAFKYKYIMHGDDNACWSQPGWACEEKNDPECAHSLTGYSAAAMGPWRGGPLAACAVSPNSG